MNIDRYWHWDWLYLYALAVIIGRGPRKSKKRSQLEVSAESDRGQNSCFDTDMSSDDETINVAEPERTSTKRGSSNVSTESAEKAEKARSETNKKEVKKSIHAGGVFEVPQVKPANISASTAAAVLKGSAAMPHAAATTAVALVAAAAAATVTAHGSELRSLATDALVKVKSVTYGVHECVFYAENVALGGARTIVNPASEYKATLFDLLAESARLKGPY